MRKNKRTFQPAVRRLLSAALAAVMAASLALSPLPAATPKGAAEKAEAADATLKNPRIVPDEGMRAGQKVTWDCVWFGSYPQAEVISSGMEYTALDASLRREGDVIVSDSVYSALQNASGWDANNDITLDGAKYRRMKKGDATCSNQNDTCYQWSSSTDYHYFKYEPIKWRVLHTDGNQALLLSDVALDDQWDWYTAGEYDTWETSTVRSWLNGYGAGSNQQSVDYSRKNFIGSAFTASEQAAIVNSSLENADNIRYGTSGGNNTTDKVFLLSETDVWNTDAAESYGFVRDWKTNDEARCCEGSTYAKAMGMYSFIGIQTDYDGNCDWWLRSPGECSNIAMYVFFNGLVLSGGDSAYEYGTGVRPALNLNLSSPNLYTYAGTVCSDGTDTEVGGGTVPPGGETPEAPLKKLTLTVYENHEKNPEKGMKYELSDGAEVSAGTTKYRTGTDGVAEAAEGNWGEAVISKKGYSTRRISKKWLKQSRKVYLQPSAEKPVINAVWIGNTDVMNEEYAVDLLKSDAVTLEAEIDWGKHGYGKVELAQKGAKQTFSNGTLRMVLKNKFDVSDTIYLRATDDKGNVSVRELKLKADGAVPAWANGIKFSIDSKIGITLPKSWPFVGGAKVGLDVVNFLPVSVGVEDNKVYATIGIDVAQYTKSDKYATNAASKSRAHVLNTETKLLWQNIKDAVKQKDRKKTLEKLKNIKSTYGTAMKYPQGSFGFSADFTIIGYLEGYVTPQGSFEFLDGKVIFSPSVSWDWSGQFAIGPVPCYWEAQIKGEAEAKWNVYRSAQAKGFLPAGELEATVSGSVGAGVGINKVATIGGGGKLAFKPYVKISPASPYFSMKTSINAYFKAKLGFFEYRHDFEPIKEWFVEYPATKKARAVSEEADVFAWYDAGLYQAQDLSYLEKGSEFLANRKSAVKSRAAESSGETVFKTNTYAESAPKLAAFSDGSKIAVWIDSGSSAVNDICLYYSYFDGSAWSEPRPVEGDGTVDFQPELAVIDDVAYVVWQDGRRAFGEGDTLDTMAYGMGISAAVFDREERSFRVSELEEGNNGLCMTPKVCGGNGEVAVLWLNNSMYDWFGMRGKNAVWASRFDGSSWSAPGCMYEDLGSVSGFTAGYADGELSAAWCEDSDNDPNTTEDLVVYLDGDTLEEAEDAAQVSAPLMEGGSLYWYQDGTVMCREQIYGSEGTAVTEKGVIATDNFRVVCDGENRAVVYPVSDGLSCELYGVFYDSESGKWGSPKALTDFGKSISGFSGAWTESGMELLLNRIDVTGDYEAEEPYGTANLALLAVGQSCDIGIEEITADAGTILPGAQTLFRVEMKNHGNKAGNYKINILDSEGNILSSMEAQDALLPGQTQTFTYPYKILEERIGTRLTFEAEERAGQDADTANNRKEFTLDYRDISAEGTGWGAKEDGGVCIYTTVVNRGYHTETGVRVNLRETSAEGSVVDSMEVGELESFDSRYAAFHVPYEKDKVYYVEVSAPEEDGQTGNNADFVVLDSAVYEKASQRQLYELKVSKTKTVYTEGEAFTSSDLIVKARYADGTEEDVTKAAKLDASGVNMKKAGVYTCTVSYGGKTAVFKVTVKAKEQANAPRPTVKPPVKKKITTLQIKAKKNAKKITVKTMKKSKVKITLNKKILIKGRRKVKSITISPSKNKTGKIVLKLSKRLPKKTVIKVQVSRPGYVTKKRTVKIK